MRINIYLPDDLHDRMLRYRGAATNWSATAQQAFELELATLGVKPDTQEEKDSLLAVLANWTRGLTQRTRHA